jgi:protein-tyrosine phosphatase
MKILMVCLGNICRSPLAEGILKHKIIRNGLNWEVDSAGTYHFHIGEQPHHLSIAIAKKHGIDIREQRARLLTKEDFLKYDIIYAMSNDVIEEMKQFANNNDFSNILLIMNELHPNLNEDVEDPWGGTTEDFELVYNKLDAVCESIIKKYKSSTI